MTQPTDDDARLANIRNRYVEQGNLPPYGDVLYLLRLLDEARAERDAKQKALIQYLNEDAKVAAERDALAAKLAKASVLIKDVRDNGLIYWEPNTSRGAVSKAFMYNRIAEILSALDDIGGRDDR